MDKEHFRFYIKVRTALHIQLTGLFKGREEVEDEERSGRPVTETTSENVDWISDLINDDPYLTFDEIEQQTSLSHDTVQQIISDRLHVTRCNPLCSNYPVNDAIQLRCCIDGFFRAFDELSAGKKKFS
ncbi:unnamed protein product [Adineta ricciae]|uniref:Uncharacterized protein n=1 Tax=Adineta ricciae TaxID=249248 RepID=A0A814ID16_ADIRI|nr:unnamed protein product [Adineta ricciae]CAF1435818.1 unnamed protein product [Adineta ricciae]